MHRMTLALYLNSQTPLTLGHRASAHSLPSAAVQILSLPPLCTDVAWSCLATSAEPGPFPAVVAKSF